MYRKQKELNQIVEGNSTSTLENLDKISKSFIETNKRIEELTQWNIHQDDKMKKTGFRIDRFEERLKE